MEKQTNKVSILLAIAMVFMLLASSGGIIAGKTGAAINNVDTGVVNIEVDEYTINDKGEEVPWEDGIGVLPGSYVSKIPYFTATGNTCYIRAKVEIAEERESGLPITPERLDGVSNKWVKAGDYFYYKVPLKTNDKVKFFEGFEIPNWLDDVNPRVTGDWGISLTVTVDAIQAEHFTPDFNSKSPWGDVVIKESIHKDGYDVNTFTTNSETNLNVTIEDKDNIVVKPEDFFEGFKTMVPGDTLTDSVEINVKERGEVFFSTESITDIDLLNNMTLKIVLTKAGKDKVIYDGKLNADLNLYSLGIFEKNEKATMTFTVHMPKELDNQYTLRKGTVKWTFAMTPKPLPSSAVQTGDNFNIYPYIAIAVIALITLCVVLFRRKKEERSESNA